MKRPEGFDKPATPATPPVRAARRAPVPPPTRATPTAPESPATPASAQPPVPPARSAAPPSAATPPKRPAVLGGDGAKRASAAAAEDSKRPAGAEAKRPAGGKAPKRPSVPLAGTPGRASKPGAGTPRHPDSSKTATAGTGTTAGGVPPKRPSVPVASTPRRQADDRSVPAIGTAKDAGRTKAAPTAADSARSARRELRRAARERRRFERGEVRRFTRRSRSRRTAWLSAGGVVAVLGIVLAVAVYSPLLALKTITVDGTSRVSADEVSAAVADQLGTPLALLDYSQMTDDLAAFPLIRSYVTEMVPPSTLLIHITERAPVGALQNGATFDLVDPAGIVVQSTPERPEGVPLIAVGASTTGEPAAETPAFASAVEVLLALPADLLTQVDTITATTRDDVTFVLRGVGQTVVWGSADDSAYKARVLAEMVAKQDPAALLQYDVSARGSVVVTPR
jgi:cell division protein FtsQ